MGKKGKEGRGRKGRTVDSFEQHLVRLQDPESTVVGFLHVFSAREEFLEAEKDREKRFSCQSKPCAVRKRRETRLTVGSIPSGYSTGLVRDLNVEIDLGVIFPNRISLSMSTKTESTTEWVSERKNERRRKKTRRKTKLALILLPEDLSEVDGSLDAFQPRLGFEGKLGDSFRDGRKLKKRDETRRGVRSRERTKGRENEQRTWKKSPVTMI